MLHEGDCSTDLYNDRTFARIFGALHRCPPSPAPPPLTRILLPPCAARIRRYAAFPWLKRLALAVAARSLTRQQTLRELVRIG